MNEYFSFEEKFKTDDLHQYVQDCVEINVKMKPN